jgi:hypothetical protein
LKPAARPETLFRVKRLLIGFVLGFLAARAFDALTTHEPVVRPPPLELADGGAAAPRPSPTGARKLPMRIRVDAVDAPGRTLISERKDGVRIRSVVGDRAEIRNGFAAATFEQIKVGDMVNGSRIKRADDEYEVLTITKFEPSREALDKQEAARLLQRAAEAATDRSEQADDAR